MVAKLHAGLGRITPLSVQHSYIHACVSPTNSVKNATCCYQTEAKSGLAASTSERLLNDGSGTYLVELRGVFDPDFERDARVFALLPRGALDDVVLAVRKAARHRLSYVAHERVVVDADDLEIETTRVLGIHTSSAKMSNY